MTSDAAEIPIGGTRKRALLQRLLVSANRPVPVDRLADDLWNGDPPAQFTSTLQSHVHNLRLLIGGDRLVNRHGAYQLHVDDGELDVDRFEGLASEGRSALSGGTPADARRLLGSALACWRGPALLDVADWGWAQGEARRLDEEQAAVTELWLEAGLALGDHLEVVSLAEKAVVEHPYRERLWAHLMVALYRCGRQADALTAYQRIRSLLADDLGLEPSRGLAELEGAILRQDPALDPTGSGCESVLVTVTPSLGDGGTSRIGTRTLLFTDVVESVYLWEHAPEGMEGAIRQLAQISAASVAKHHGRVVTTMGDGLFAAFETAADGLAAAVAIQREVDARDWPGIGRIPLRIGLNTGSCHLFGRDIYGRPVNVAARLQALANGGQIVVADSTVRECRDGLPEGLSTISLGHHRLRGVERPVHVHMVVADGLRADFPPLRTPATDLEEMPNESSPLIGREALLAQVSEAVTSHPLITLWGQGGTGKTRLAIRVARMARRPFLEGVRFADLASVKTGDEAAKSLLTLLRAQPVTGEAPLATIIRVLRPLHLLLVLDNVEHVRGPVSELVESVRAACPWVHVLLTSREALGLPGERRIAVPPLTVPGEHSDDPEYIAQFESTRMFVERARAVVSDFELDAGNAAAVARLCRAVEGLPLALELAAARLDVDTVAELSEAGDELVDRLERHSSAARGDSLMRSLEWSMDQLNDREEALFESLAAFAGPFSREQARGIAERPDSVDRDLDRLVRTALLRRDQETTRFTIPLISRQYAQRRHGQNWDRVRDRHARLMLRCAEETSPRFRGGDQPVASRILRAQFPDHREAMRWFLEHQLVDEGSALLVALFQFAFNQLLTEVNQWAVQVERLVPDGHPLVTEVCGAAALASWSSGDTEAAVSYGRRALVNSEAGTGGSTIWARTALQNAWGYVGRMDLVAPHHLALIEECRRSEDVYWNVQGLGMEAISLWMAGAAEKAEQKVTRAIAVSRRLGNAECIHWAMYCRGRILQVSDPDAASAAYEEAMDAARSVDSRFYLALDLLEWASLKRRLGEPLTAAVAVLELLDLLHSAGNTSQISQMYLEIAQLLAAHDDVPGGAIVMIARRDLPQMPKAAHESESEHAVRDQLRSLAGDEWSVYESHAMAISGEALMSFARTRLERLLEG